jgi:hypothetical protein
MLDRANSAVRWLLINSARICLAELLSHPH